MIPLSFVNDFVIRLIEDHRNPYQVDAHQCQSCRNSKAAKIVRLGDINYYLCNWCEKKLKVLEGGTYQSPLGTSSAKRNPSLQSSQGVRP